MVGSLVPSLKETNASIKQKLVFNVDKAKQSTSIKQTRQLHHSEFCSSRLTSNQFVAKSPHGPSSGVHWAESTSKFHFNKTCDLLFEAIHSLSKNKLKHLDELSKWHRVLQSWQLLEDWVIAWRWGCLEIGTKRLELCTSCARNAFLENRPLQN